MSSASLARVAVVVPIASAELLEGCLQSLLALRPRPERIVIVDDSRDGLLLPDWVEQLRTFGVGPYAARNAGWRYANDCDVILFCDVRSRPHPTWAARLRNCFEDPQVALAGTDTRVVPLPGAAAQSAVEQQYFSVQGFVLRPFFLPYLPTCNLAVRRNRLEQCAGFREVRSGADADLCWRIQQAGGALAVVAEALMDWVPRTRVIQLLEQQYRYGASHHALLESWSEQGATLPLPRPLWRIAAVAGLRLASICLPSRRVRGVTALCDSAFQIGYNRASRRHRLGVVAGSS